MKEDSIRNWRMMSRFREPTARRMPISTLRSFTMRIMIERMPSAPIRKEAAAAIRPRTVIRSIARLLRTVTSFRSTTPKPPRSGRAPGPG